jgi:hypothetical protein
MEERHFDVLSETEVPSEPDVLLFSPLDSSVLVVGTYHFQANGTRVGGLLTYTVDPSTHAWYSNYGTILIE